MPNVLLVRYGDASFIRRDAAILAEHYPLREIDLSRKTVPTGIRFLRDIAWADLVYCWFAGVHAVTALHLSKLLKKPFIVNVGGYETAYAPDIGYGAFTTKKGASTSKTVFAGADRVIVVDPSLWRDALDNARIDGKNFRYIPTGYDTSLYVPNGKKEPMVLTVCTLNRDSVRRKGIITFLEVAQNLSDIPFVIVGKDADGTGQTLRRTAPKNAVFTGYVPEEQLIRFYQRAKVYCQLSRYEGLPNSLCEAMLCDCVPVGTSYCGIPTAIGDTGVYVPYGDTEQTTRAVCKGLQSYNGPAARERICKMFPAERRERELIREIEGLTK